MYIKGILKDYGHFYKQDKETILVYRRKELVYCVDTYLYDGIYDSYKEEEKLYNEFVILHQDVQVGETTRRKWKPQEEDLFQSYNEFAFYLFNNGYTEKNLLDNADPNKPFFQDLNSENPLIIKIDISVDKDLATMMFVNLYEIYMNMPPYTNQGTHPHTKAKKTAISILKKFINAKTKKEMNDNPGDRSSSHFHYWEQIIKQIEELDFLIY